ncbi:MAG TPA: PfkB family carbohydrate kinase [Xanthobacteraceae bacterium]|nr:PfkB family carbohydrate kinase [Xanthobacteraceae bacterium]
MAGGEKTPRAGRSGRKAAARPTAPRILCAGIIVLDEVFRVEALPPPDGKVEAKGFFIVNGGCAANAAVAIARLGGRAALSGPVGSDANGDFVLKALARENVDCAACRRLAGTATALSAIFIDPRGDRTIVTYRDERVAAAAPADPAALAAAADLLLADNRYPRFVRPICEAARRRNLPIVLDGDKATVADDPLFRIATHVVFSSECLIATTGRSDLADGLRRIAEQTDAFLAVSNGPNDILFLDGRALRRVPVFKIRAVDTLGAGDALHGGFALALAEGKSEREALRFGAAVAGLKCTRIGGSAGAPTRTEVEAFLAEYEAPAPARKS